MTNVSEDFPAFVRRAVNSTFNRRSVEQAITIFQKHVRDGVPIGKALIQTAQETGLGPRDLQSYLTAHGLIEAAEYDYGHDDPTRRRPYRIDAYDHKSRPDMPLRYTGNYADNPMHDPAHLNEDEDSVLHRLREILRAAQIEDDEILAGVKLTQRGYQKIAARLGLAASEIPMLMQSLATEIRREGQRLQEDDLGVAAPSAPAPSGKPRFTYETDFLDNVTIRDSVSGKETFLRGSNAMEALDRLDGGEDEQAVLASYASIMEDDDGRAVEARNDGDYEKEIAADGGTYNFPWSVGTRSGTATARFSDKNGEFAVEVIHVRDEGGKRIDDPRLNSRLQQTAWDFIGDE